MNTYSDFYQEEVSPDLDIENSNLNQNEVKSGLDMVFKKSIPYLDQISKTVNFYLNMDPNELGPNVDMAQKEFYA